MGSKLWSLDGTRTVQTTVVEMTAVKAREVVDVVTDRVTFTVAAIQELSTPDGWVPAVDAAGCVLAWTHTKKLCRERLTIRPGYEFGYFVGASGYLKRDVPGPDHRGEVHSSAEGIRLRIGRHRSMAGARDLRVRTTSTGTH